MEIEDGLSLNTDSSDFKNFIITGMKAVDVKIMQEVNDEIFSRGMKDPKTKIRVMCSKDDKKIVTVNLIKQAQ